MPWHQLSPDSNVHGTNMGPIGADRTQVAPCWPHEHCYLRSFSRIDHKTTILNKTLDKFVISYWLALAENMHEYYFVGQSQLFGQICSFVIESFINVNCYSQHWARIWLVELGIILLTMIFKANYFFRLYEQKHRTFYNNIKRLNTVLGFVTAVLFVEKVLCLKQSFSILFQKPFLMQFNATVQ